jgi:enolase
LIEEAVHKAGYQMGVDVGFGMDVAAEMFYQDGKYVLKSEGRTLSSEGMVDLLESWVEKYPIILIEDPLGEDDFDGWKLATRRLGGRAEIIGDDLFTTNMKRFTDGIAQGMANGILVKPNQIGTLTETLEIIAEARAAGYWVVISRRSGETEDTTIADLAVATNCGQIKFGSFSRSEGLAKYNRLLRIEESLGSAAVYRGSEILQRLQR